jgi:L-lactate dehydrogenase
MFKGKISIIGAGFVGSTTAYTIMQAGLASEIVLIDINKDKAEGDVMDMNHGISFVSPVKISTGGYELIKNSSVIIITAGVNQKPGETRIDLLKRNTAVFKSIFDEILKYCNSETIILVVTNPVDILTYIALKISGMNKKNIFGSGTVLDTARLKYLIGEHTNIDVRDIHTYIIGEHGDTEVAAWSLTNIAGINIDEYCGLCKRCDGDKKICKTQYAMMTKNAAYDIINKKGATYYAVALSVKRIIECVTGNENSILTVSSYLDGEYGIKDICLSVPTIVNSKGIDTILEVPFADEEIKALRYSADALKELAKQAGI